MAGHFPEGETRDQVAMNIDWFPTIVELCGLNTDGLEIDGKSLVPLIKGECWNLRTMCSILILKSSGRFVMATGS